LELVSNDDKKMAELAGGEIKIGDGITVIVVTRYLRL
jgi:hypothetical protein